MATPPDRVGEQEDGMTDEERSRLEKDVAETLKAARKERQLLRHRLRLYAARCGAVSSELSQQKHREFREDPLAERFTLNQALLEWPSADQIRSAIEEFERADSALHKLEDEYRDIN
jgi:hypothetical protein